MTSKLQQLVENAERIGVIGSPSSTSQIALDILAGAVNNKLVGELALFRYLQEQADHYALGQITEISLRNVWHEDPTMRSLIRQRGRVDAVSERQDTHQGDMIVSAVFSDQGASYRPSMLGTVPATGTPIYLVDDNVLNEVLSPYKDQLFYLGHVYGSRPMLPMWFKHFDSGADGAGEAYHIGVFGKTGSGKSVLAKMMLMAYARHKKMSILIIDPQGEFSQDVAGQGALGGFRLPVSSILTHYNRPSRVISVKNLILDRWELFAQILFESRFFEQLSMTKGENRDLAANALKDNLPKKKIALSRLHERNSFEVAWQLLGNERIQMTFYRAAEARERFKFVYESADKDTFYNDYWLPVCQLFRDDRRDGQKVDHILARLFDTEQQRRPVIVIDLSAETSDNLFWNDTIRALVIKRLLEGIRLAAERAYAKKENLNTLIVMDEAHRLAPAETPQNDYEKQVRSIFIDAVRTTRKYGVGWMFISQTLSSLHREINQQLRIFFFGFGLGMGAEYQALSELVGGRSQALDLYKLFRDPHSAFDVSSRAYSFMTIGPVSPLSFAGTPLFLSAFTKPEDFLKANGLQLQQKLIAT